MPKVVFVTGGSSGIGKATCEYLASQGFIVYGSSRNAKNGDKLDDFTLVEMDVLKPTSIQSAIAFILQKEGKIDVLVNNAGLGMAGAVEDTSTEEINRIFATNFTGMLEVCKEVIPSMREKNKGLIINISSIAGQFGLPFRGVYSAAKAAIELISESLSLELMPFNIKVCIIEPGDFKTNINNNRKIAEKSLKEESHYYKAFTKVYNSINSEVSNAKEPVAVGKKIHSIIKTENPKLRYRVATPIQILAIFLHNALPGRVFEKILTTKYNTK